MVKVKKNSQTSPPAVLKKRPTGITGPDQIRDGGADCGRMQLE